MKSVILCISLFWAATTQPSGASAMDLVKAKRYFEEAAELSNRDGGALLGIELYGPMMFVDPKTREIVANQADRKQRLNKQDDVFIGKLPSAMAIANTSIEWAGVHWTMLRWPLPPERISRASLMMHECFHRIQAKIGLAAKEESCAHLDTELGRYWLRLEWRALAAALGTGGDSQSAAKDALMFRAVRHQEFSDASRHERLLELHEGIAEYVGQKLCGLGPSGLARQAQTKLSEAESNETFTRSFAYASGPAYGLLLDRWMPQWRDKLDLETDLAGQLALALNMEFPKDIKSAASQRALRYDGEKLREEERTREEERRELMAHYRQRLFEGPVLRLTLRQPRTVFDPRTLVPYEEVGTIYPTLRLSDVWGVLDVTGGGALITSEWSAARVSATGIRESKDKGATISGDGWTLAPAPGWTLENGSRAGDYSLRKTENK